MYFTKLIYIAISENLCSNYDRDEFILSLKCGVMPQIQKQVYLITQKQRDALLNYLLDRPYREVATGVEFLNNAPSTMINLQVPDDQLESISGEKQPESQPRAQEEQEIQIANAPTEELTVFNAV